MTYLTHESAFSVSNACYIVIILKFGEVMSKLQSKKKNSAKFFDLSGFWSFFTHLADFICMFMPYRSYKIFI